MKKENDIIAEAIEKDEKRWIRYTIIARQQGTPRRYTDDYACVAGYCLSTLGISYTKKETLFISYIFLGDEAEEILYKKGISKKDAESALENSEIDESGILEKYIRKMAGKDEDGQGKC